MTDIFASASPAKRRLSRPDTALCREVRRMPELSHWPHRPEPLDIHQSEVVTWLCRQATVKEWVFATMRARGYIVYDPSTKKWRGVRT